MRILIVTPYYLPDGGPSSPLFAMLSESLVKLGHAVTVIVSVPHYPSGRVNPEFRGFKTICSIENGVRVIRVPVPSLNRLKLVLRMVQFLIYQLNAIRAGRRLDYDVVLLSNPFLMVGLPFAYFAYWRKKPSVYSIYDVYPDVGVKSGVFRHPLLIWAVAFFEKLITNHAQYVSILSESFELPLLALGVPKEKLEHISVWADTELIKPISKYNSFSREFHLVDKFVILYAGNIGLSQGLENVLRTAEMLKDNPLIKFVFVGDGIGKRSLYNQAQIMELNNVQFIPYQPRDHLPEVLAAADVSLVMLKRGIGSDSLPSKSFSILASGRPILASVDEDSDMTRLVQRSKAGVCIPPDDPICLANAIINLLNDSEGRERMGKAGREYVTAHHSALSAAQAFERLLIRAKQLKETNR